MNRAELEQRLLELERRIEAARTDIWLAEHDREQLRFELRRLMQAESKAVAP